MLFTICIVVCFGLVVAKRLNDYMPTCKNYSIFETTSREALEPRNCLNDRIETPNNV